MRVSRTYGGNYYKAEEMAKPLLLTIDEVNTKTFEDGKTKMIVSFREDNQQLVCNQTNAQTIAELYGDETDDWTGERIVLFAEKVQFGNKKVPGIRVRAPRPAANNGQAPAPVRQHAPVLTQAEADDVQTDDDRRVPF